MLPKKPFIFKMFYQWIVDSDCTPYINVDTQVDHVCVPKEHIKNHQIVLNISPHSVSDLVMENRYISFFADFSGEEQFVYLPMLSIAAIYAKENGEGIMFDGEDDHHPLMQPIAPPTFSSTDDYHKEDTKVIHVDFKNKDKS